MSHQRSITDVECADRYTRVLQRPVLRASRTQERWPERARADRDSHELCRQRTRVRRSRAPFELSGLAMAAEGHSQEHLRRQANRHAHGPARALNRGIKARLRDPACHASLCGLEIEIGSAGTVAVGRCVALVHTCKLCTTRAELRAVIECILLRASVTQQCKPGPPWSGEHASLPVAVRLCSGKQSGAHWQNAAKLDCVLAARTRQTHAAQAPLLASARLMHSRLQTSQVRELCAQPHLPRSLSHPQRRAHAFVCSF